MKNLYVLALAILSQCLSVSVAKAQISKFEGTWEMLRAPNPNGNAVPFFTTLRTFDKTGNYVEIGVSAGGAFIQAKAKFELTGDSTINETINYAANESKVGKSFSFGCRFVTQSNHQFLITEGGRKTVNGVETPEWREVWRKIEEFRKP